MNIKQFWVVEYSRSNDKFHVETVADLLKKSMRAFVDKASSDYMVMFISENREDADKACAELKKRVS